ncbi:hypothetical protein [Endozoicomonas sp. 8E]|uniref:hypothetical protein n=1 Tax=Endozoicomonas sp. 8E TaxID=3035692 RepID=UPI00293926F1|nr:hypothetical protein [Endozoicomonas sp. 8E]WOG27014.1 hypothetical protein P6910_21050 [Endozoicomonas sp. 8E]
MTLFVVCWAKTLATQFIVELEQNAVISNQSFSTEPDRPALTANSSDNVGINCFAGPDLALHYKQQIFICYSAIRTLFESISWQLLYTTNCLVAFKLTLTTRDLPLSSNPYSWLPVGEAIAVGWFLKNYWNPDSSLLNPIERHEATAMLTLGNHPLATITKMFSSGNNQQTCQQQDQTSELSGQHTSPATRYFISVLYSRSGDGNEGRQQQQHTLGLNCFVSPCHGVCKFRSASVSTGQGEWPLNSVKGSTGLTAATSEQNSHLQANKHCLCCIIQISPVGALHPQQNSSIRTLDEIFDIELEFNPAQLCQPPAHWRQAHGIDVDSMTAAANSTTAGQKNCDKTLIGKGGQTRSCPKVCMNAKAIWEHKRRFHTDQQICYSPVVGEDGKQRQCRKICNNAKALSSHRARHHGKQKTCDLTMITKDGLQRPCGKVCKNSKVLLDHKRSTHTGQQTCYTIVVREDGQQRPCGKVCNNTLALLNHQRAHRKRKPADANPHDDPSPRKVKANK